MPRIGGTCGGSWGPSRRIASDAPARQRHVLRLEPALVETSKAVPYRDRWLWPVGWPVAEGAQGPKTGHGTGCDSDGELVPLNFRDALNALGMLPEYAAELGIGSAAEMPFGFECAGTIEAVGEGVSELAPGDRVVAGPITGALATHVVADARRVIRANSELALLPWST